MKILLIEDNKDISGNIREYLELENFEIDQAFDGEVGIEKALRNEYDIILLDLMLPEVDGISICRKVVERKDTPIIMITAREGIDDRLLGFETGAIDYLVKPFDLRELSARIQVHLGKKTQTKKIQIADVSIDLEKRKFLKNEDEVHMTQKEFLIIEKLVTMKDTVVTRTDIIDYLWGSDSLFDGGDNKLDVYISNIRSKLGKNIIKTVKGVGYTLGN